MLNCLDKLSYSVLYLAPPPGRPVVLSKGLPWKPEDYTEGILKTTDLQVKPVFLISLYAFSSWVDHIDLFSFISSILSYKRPITNVHILYSPSSSKNINK